MNLTCTEIAFQQFYIGYKSKMFTPGNCYKVIREGKHSFEILDNLNRPRVISKSDMSFMVANGSSTVNPIPPLRAMFKAP